VPEPTTPTRLAIERAALAYGVLSLALALATLLWNATRPYIEWPSTSDDMFYYLTLARETAAHGVVSVDGVRPTNGFHPLWFVILRGLQPRLGDAALPGVALAILALFHAAACFALWRTLRRLAGPAPAALLAGLYAANPFVLRIVLAGVETALAACFASISLWAHVRWLERRRPADRGVSLAALALAAASRTDTVMLAAALALAPAIERWRARRDPGAALRAVDLAPVLVAALPVVAFGLWSLRATGELVQTSGRALSFWQSVGDWLLVQKAVAGLGALAPVAAPVVYALEVAVQLVGWITRAPLELLRHHPLGIALAAIALVWRFGRGRRAAVTPAGHAAADPVRGPLVTALVTFFALLWTFYALMFRHCQIWYWHTSLVAAALLIAAWLAPMRALGATVADYLASSRVPRATPALLLLVALGFTAWTMAGLRPRSPVAPIMGATMLGPLALVPAGATLAAFDTGRLGWEHPELTVVNLDGLVNNAAYRALRGRRIGRYMIEQRIEWLYVRDRVVDRFRAFGLEEWLDRADPIGRSADGVGLYRLRSAGGA
jgi:hypothetical protein